MYKTDWFDSSSRRKDLAQKSTRGGAATLISQGLQSVFQITGTVILARLLTPADFGLISMVAVVVNFARMFKDAGLSMATVQWDEINHAQISTLFWINVFISVLLGAAVFAAAPLVAAFYDRPELAPVTVWLSLSLLFGGIGIQHQALLQRHMRFGLLAMIQVGALLISLGVSVTLAYHGWRHWSLVAGMLAQALSVSLLMFIACPWVPHRLQRGTGIRGMLKFGAHLTGFNFINFFSRNADNILIGRFIGADALGLYAKAYQLFLMPISQIRIPIDQVAMPVLSSLRDTPERYARIYQRMLDILATLTIPLALYCVIEGDFLIRLALGDQWTGAVPVFRLLAITGVIQAVSSTRGMVLVSCGFSERYLRYGAYVGTFIVGSFIVGLPFGIQGVATSYAIVNYLILVPLLRYAFAGTPVTITLFFATLVPPLAISGVAALAMVCLKWLWPSDSFVLHGAYLGIFVLLYAALTLCRKTVRETVRMMLSGTFMKATA